MEQAGRLVIVALPAVHEPEVGNDARLVLLVAEVAEDVPGLLEVLNRGILGASVGEREAEVVERHRLGVRVSQVPDDRERGEVLLGRLLRLAVAPELRPERVELVGALAGIDRVKPQEPEAVHRLKRSGCEVLRSSGRGGGGRLRPGPELPRVLSHPDLPRVLSHVDLGRSRPGGSFTRGVQRGGRPPCSRAYASRGCAHATRRRARAVTELEPAKLPEPDARPGSPRA